MLLPLPQPGGSVSILIPSNSYSSPVLSFVVRKYLDMVTDSRRTVYNLKFDPHAELFPFIRSQLNMLVGAWQLRVPPRRRLRTTKTCDADGGLLHTSHGTDFPESTSSQTVEFVEQVAGLGVVRGVRRYRN